MKKTENVVVRFKKAIDNNRFYIHEELEMLEIIVNKYRLITVSDYAKRENISQPAAHKRVNSGNTPYIKLAGNTFVLGSIC